MKNIFKIVERKRTMLYIAVVMIVVGLIFSLSKSYAYFETSIAGSNVTLGVGKLIHSLNSDLRLKSGEKKEVNLFVKSNDDIASKYQVYYTSSDDLTDVLVGYSSDSTDLPSGEIEAKGVKSITIVLENTSSNEVSVEIGVRGGLANNSVEDIVLEEGEYRVVNVLEGVSDSEAASERKNNVIDALAYSNLGLTYDSTWDEIISALKSAYPAYLDVLGTFTTSDWNVTSTGYKSFTFTQGTSLVATAGTYTGGHFDGTLTIYSKKIDITNFNKLVTIFTKSYGNNAVPIYRLVASNGTLNLSSGTNDISGLTGEAQLYIYASSSRSPENSALSLGSVTITQIKFQA